MALTEFCIVLDRVRWIGYTCSKCLMRDIKYTKYSNIIQSIQQDKPFIKVAMQTVVFNAQL